MSLPPRKLTAREVTEIHHILIWRVREALEKLEKLERNFDYSSSAELQKQKSKRLFDLEFGVLQPLFYYLECHLIDWASCPFARATENGRYRASKGLTWRDTVRIIPNNGCVHESQSGEGVNRQSSGTGGECDAKVAGK